MAGRDVDSVYVRDTLPKGMAFVDFVGSCPLEENGATMKHSKLADGRDVIEWFIPKMQVKQKGTITYTANITFPSGKSCQTDDETIVNTAWISGSKNSPLSDTANITVTCSKVPEPIKPTTLTKVADKRLIWWAMTSPTPSAISRRMEPTSPMSALHQPIGHLTSGLSPMEN